MTRSFQIGAASAAADLAEVERLFEAYAASLLVDLSYQGFTEELAGLPGDYAAPEGALLLARDESGRAIGCVAMRPLGDDGACEMKRLYVAPEGRGMGLGRALAEAIVAEAKRCGYRAMFLDTLPDMATAQALYRNLGFEETGAYYETPVEGTKFMRLELG